MDLKKFEKAQKKFQISTFKLSAFIQKRARELVYGAPSLASSDSLDLLDMALNEVLQEKISLEEKSEEEESEESLHPVFHPPNTVSNPLAALARS